MRVLGIETSGPFSGVAVAERGKILAEVTVRSENLVSQHLFPEIIRVLDNARTAPRELDGVAVSLGPGRFTGLRVGIAAAVGLARGLGTPLAGVPTLDVVARGLRGDYAAALVLTDAGKKRVYAAAYRSSETSGLERVTPFVLMEPEEALSLAPDATLAGEGAYLYRKRLEAAAGGNLSIAPESEAYPSPVNVAIMGAEKIAAREAGEPGSLRPIYVRPSEAEEKFGRILIDVTGRGNGQAGSP